MGARQSRRSVDITTTPKKDGLPEEDAMGGDAAAPGDGKLEKIEETDLKPTTNGVALHTDVTPEDKDKDKDEATEKDKDKEDAPKVEELKLESPTTETPAEGAAEVTTPTEGTPASPTTTTSPENKETKKKDKSKKKWSFRSISFGKKDKNKPVREDAPKNGDVAKETLAEGGEEAETAAAPSSPVDEKSAVSSPTEKEESSEAVAEEALAVGTEAKPEEEDKSAAVAAAVAPVVAAVAASATEEKKEEPSTPAPTPVPVEAQKVEEIEKQVEPANADKKVEVSPVQAVIEAPVEVNSQSKPMATTTTTTTTTTTATAPSIIERKTSEDFPSQLPSSPPPTPIDPSPLQQAQQVAANASAIAEALKLPAEAANKASIAIAASVQQPPQSTTSPASPTSSCRVERFSAILTTSEQSSSDPPTSEYHEQTGDASLITTTTTTIAAFTDITESPSSEPQKTDLQVTEVQYESRVVDNENNDTRDQQQIEMVSEEIIETQSFVETIDTATPSENDLVIETEEGPIPVSVPRESIEPVQLPPTESEVNRENEEPVLPEPVESTEVLITPEDIKTSEVPQILSEPIIPIIEANNEENPEKDVPPPLPASPVPVPKSTSQLLNFMSSQIEDSPVIDASLLPEEISCPLPPPKNDLPEAEEQSQLANQCQALLTEEQKDSSCSLPPPNEISVAPVEEHVEEHVEEQVEKHVEEQIEKHVEEQIEKHVEEPVTEKYSPSVRETESTINPEIPEVALNPAVSIPEIPTDTTLLTPPRSPSPSGAIKISDVEIPTRESSQLELLDDSSNREFKTESVEESLNSYNDSELELKERLTVTVEENTLVSCQLSNAIQENDQSITEMHIEHNVVANVTSTTVINDDAPKSPPPAVPAEIPAPTLGPAITEDVASVTKAIEEIDINEKAVAAAVNENIESANTNEIIADMNHQNNMNE